MTDAFARFSRIRASRHGRVLKLELSNPGLRNAVDAQMHHELSEIFTAAQEDPESLAVLLTGDQAGNAFCAGGDIRWMRESLETGSGGPGPVEAKRIVASLLDMEKPIVAAINGPAVGLGATIALLCDVIFIGESGHVADPHVRVGVVAGDGGALIWPQLIGVARAKEYLMTGDPVPAAEAERIGLVNRVVADDALQDAAMTFARRLAEGAPQAVQHTKTAVNLLLKQLWPVFEASLAYEMQSFKRDDHREAVSAFLEKRPPRFTNS